MTPIDALGNFTTRWFDINANDWMTVFRSEQLFEKPIEVVEIGSWEGRSTLFFLHYLKAAHVTAVDTWQGSDEHQGFAPMPQVEASFDSNVSGFGHRLTKIRASSKAYFAARVPEQQFDIIYVDGSHHADDVMIDALESFAILKPGGILFFDDYPWKFYKVMRHNPVFALIKKESTISARA
jgi:predicted O-methyltransferase YrrM